MKTFLVIIGAMLLTGCAAQPAQTQAVQPLSAGTTVSSAALAFDPPMTLNQRPLDLSRDGRGEAAFAGYENTTTTYFDVWTDDRRTTDSTENYVREAYVEQVGSNSR
jgi:uncharacterized lipoprotein YajG